MMMSNLFAVKAMVPPLLGLARSVFGLARRYSWIGVFCLLTAGGVVVFLAADSLPKLEGTIRFAALDSPVTIATDDRGIPSIRAHNRNDSLRALGYVHARDRLFQMDLMRRRSAGRLAEIFGSGNVEEDKWHKIMGFDHVAGAILARLPDDQRDALHAYAQGVNGALAQTRILPWEFLVLGYRPEPWRAEDSLLVILGLYERLSWSGPNERAATVMEKAFSTRGAEFFFPARDCYTESLFGADIAKCQLDPVPVESLRSAGVDKASETSFFRSVDRPRKGGSNAWVISPSKSRSGRAILANDMHLDLLVPNIWYRADLTFERKSLTELTLPGLPMPLSGSNGRVAWGFTNVSGDFSDLILLDADAKDEQIYLTPDGPRQFDERRETIRVRGEPEVSLMVRDTIWGPVLQERLLDKQVAVRWTALDPTATDLKLLDLDRVASVTEALDLFNNAGGPALNALAADTEGNIGWTYTGKFPVRIGFSGLAATSWSNGTHRWEGYIAAQELPRIVNPAEGFIVSANQRMTGGPTPMRSLPISTAAIAPIALGSGSERCNT